MLLEEILMQSVQPQYRIASALPLMLSIYKLSESLLQVSHAGNQCLPLWLNAGPRTLPLNGLSKWKADIDQVPISAANPVILSTIFQFFLT